MPKKKPVDLFEDDSPGVGHNGVNSKVLLGYVERIENLAEEKQALSEDMKEVFSEAKGQGLDVKAMRAVIKIRKMDREKWRALEEQTSLYLSALGML
jgi:uncharacterized protein (UPF0335 family)